MDNSLKLFLNKCERWEYQTEISKTKANILWFTYIE